MSELFIGLMSGTSLDGIDAVLVDFAPRNGKPQLLGSYSQAIPAALTTRIQQLCDAQSPGNEINQLGDIDRQLGKLFAQAVNTLCRQSGVDKKHITAIGSHGQTVRHYPDGENGFTLQIGDANTIATQSGIDVIADFRKKDIALGGQGAPLVPAFHQAVFADDSKDRLIVNIGGIANLTFLAANGKHPTCGFDTGPGNTLMDGWIQQHKGQPYDACGQWAQSGQLNEALLAELLSDDFFQQLPPKSSGREKFNLQWLAQGIKRSQSPGQSMRPQDVQRTLMQLTAESLAQAIRPLADGGDIYLCGGGSHNQLLVTTIGACLPQFKVLNTHALGVDPDWVEAMAFAWLARAHTLNQPGNVPSVTGAKRPAVLGGYFPAL